MLSSYDAVNLGPVILGRIFLTALAAGLVLFSVRPKTHYGKEREGFWSSSGDEEEARNMVTDAFIDTLDRYPTPTEKNDFVRLVMDGVADRDLIISILKDTREYLEKEGKTMLDVLRPPIRGVDYDASDDTRDSDYPDGKVRRSILDAYIVLLDRLPTDSELKRHYKRITEEEGTINGVKADIKKTREYKELVEAQDSAPVASANQRNKNNKQEDTDEDADEDSDEDADEETDEETDEDANEDDGEKEEENDQDEGDGEEKDDDDLLKDVIQIFRDVHGDSAPKPKEKVMDVLVNRYKKSDQDEDDLRDFLMRQKRMSLNDVTPSVSGVHLFGMAAFAPADDPSIFTISDSLPNKKSKHGRSDTGDPTRRRDSVAELIEIRNKELMRNQGIRNNVPYFAEEDPGDE